MGRQKEGGRERVKRADEGRKRHREGGKEGGGRKERRR